MAHLLWDNPRTNFGILHRLWGALSLVATLAVTAAPHAVTRAQSGTPLTAQGTDHGVQVSFQRLPPLLSVALPADAVPPSASLWRTTRAGGEPDRALRGAAHYERQCRAHPQQAPAL